VNPPLIFITGASGGLGLALAERYYRAGYRLALSAPDANEIRKIQNWAQARQLQSQRYQTYEADLAVTGNIVAAGQACIENQGVPDVVIACAGVTAYMNSSKPEALDTMARVMTVNAVGVAATFHPFINPMTARGSGQLVGIASVAGIRGLPWHGAYGSSKAAAIHYCECLRIDLRDTGVKVLTISPGYIDTHMNSAPFTRKPPFLMQPQDFAERAFRCIQAGRSYSVIPWQMGWLALGMRLLPNAIFDRAAQQWYKNLI
jgi:short-subunit dehydrogenase